VVAGRKLQSRIAAGNNRVWRMNLTVSASVPSRPVPLVPPG
jgi:hypothetical protein